MSEELKEELKEQAIIEASEELADKTGEDENITVEV
jgi:hypothetical protein